MPGIAVRFMMPGVGGVLDTYNRVPRRKEALSKELPCIGRTAGYLHTIITERVCVGGGGGRAGEKGRGASYFLKQGLEFPRISQTRKVEIFSRISKCYL